MDSFTQLFGSSHFWLVCVIYWAVANAIGALDSPTPTSSRFYAWFFKFANGFAANMTRAGNGKIPGTNGWGNGNLPKGPTP